MRLSVFQRFLFALDLVSFPLPTFRPAVVNSQAVIRDRIIGPVVNGMLGIELICVENWREQN